MKALDGDLVFNARDHYVAVFCNGRTVHGQEVTINELASAVQRRTNTQVPIEQVEYKAAYGDGFEDMMRRTPNITKIHDLVGFEPKYDLDGILDDVIASMKS